MKKNSKKKFRELTDAAYSLGLQPAQLVRRFRENKLDIFLQFYDGQTETLKSGTGVYEGQWEFPGVDNSNPIRCTIRPGIHPLTAESRDELNIRLDRGDNSISGLLIKLSWKSESIPVDPETLEPLEGEDLKKISGSNLVRVSDRITPLMDNLPRSPRVVLNVGDFKKLSVSKASKVETSPPLPKSQPPKIHPIEQYQQMLFDIVRDDWTKYGWQYGLEGRIKERLYEIADDDSIDKRKKLIFATEANYYWEFRKNDGSRRPIQNFSKILNRIKKNLVNNGEVPDDALTRHSRRK